VQERELGDEYGWKQVHGDVFRAPSHPLLFATLVGAGHQCAVVGIGVIMLAIFGDLYTGRGSLLTTMIFVYAGTAPVAGYFGGGLYARLGGTLLSVFLLASFFLPCHLPGLEV
jgi:transmembrane 9 superfamily member 3